MGRDIKVGELQPKLLGLDDTNHRANRSVHALDRRRLNRPASGRGTMLVPGAHARGAAIFGLAAYLAASVVLGDLVAQIPHREPTPSAVPEYRHPPPTYDAPVEAPEILAGIRLFVALVTAAALVALAVRRIAIPYTVALVVLGLIVAAAVPALEFVVTPELVLAVLLPGLIFEAAYQIEFDELRRSVGGIALLAIPGVILTAVIVALILYLATGLALELGFVVGAMVAATDPAAVTATFRRLGTSRRLATLVEGESLFNDGTGLVAFAIAIRVVQTEVTAVDAAVAFVLTVAVSGVIGGVVGWVASRIIATVDDHLIELTISVAAAYGTYLIADYFHESGVIATVVAGVVLGNYGRRIGMSERTQEVLDIVWEFLAFLLTALVFLLVGLAITVASLLDTLPSILWGVVAILVGRGLVVYALLGGVSRITRLGGRGQGIPVPWLHVMFWAGLRGAVAVAMAMSLPLDFPQRTLLQEITFGIVLFTLLVQGLTVEQVVKRTGAVEPPAPGS